MRTRLDEPGVPALQQPDDRTLEAHRVAQVVVPVLGVEPDAVTGVARRRVHRDDRFPGFDAGERFEHAAAERFDVGRVRGVPDGDGPCVHAVGLIGRDEPADGVEVARHDRGARRVDARDRQNAVVGRQVGGHPLDGQRDGGHASAARDRGGHLAAQRDDLRRVLQRQRTRDVRGGDLALGVTDDRVRLDAVRLPHPRQRDREREQRGLDHIDAVEVGRVRFAMQHRQQRPAGVRPQRLVAGVEVLGEDRRGLHQVQAHTGPLRAVPREDEHRLARRLRAVCQIRGRGAVPQRGQCGAEVVHSGPDGARPVGEDGAAGQGAGDGRGVHVGVGLDMAQQAFGLVAQGGSGLGGEQPGDRTAVRLVPDRVLVGRLLDDDVGVGAADAEGGDAGAARPVQFGPVAVLGEELDVPAVPVDVRGRFVDVQGAGEHPAADRLDHLDDAGDSRGGLGVADVGLDRAQPQRLVGAVLPVRGEDRLGLDGVAEGGTGAVCLHGVDVGRRQSRAGQRFADQLDLRRTVGRGEAVGGSVLVDR